MQIGILNGIYADTKGDFRTSYPKNLIPVPKEQGISKGYLRPADGIIEFGTGPGVDRGGINWNNSLFRVMGNQLCEVAKDGSIKQLGNVGGVDEPVSMAYSFSRLAIVSATGLYYYDGSTLTKVTDPDLGTVRSVRFVDGYFLLTDGTYLIVTDLSDPTQINPLKYGSAETDPDPIQSVLIIRDEPHAIGRYTIEAFSNVGGNYFPFQRIPGSLVNRGAIGQYAACEFYLDKYLGVAFVGSARNEPPSLWFAVNGLCTHFASREVDTILQEYSEDELSQVVVEARTEKAHSFLYVHLPDRTLVFDPAASAVIQEPVWFVLSSAISGFGMYRARNLVWCYDKWICGDPTTHKLGYLTNKSAHHYGDVVEWDFGTTIVYNNSEGVIFHELELIALTGEVEEGKTPTIWTSYSTDGHTYSVERPRTVGRRGKYDVRLNWLQQGNMKNWRIQKFRGTSDAYISFARLEARLEPLNS